MTVAIVATPTMSVSHRAQQASNSHIVLLHELTQPGLQMPSLQKRTGQRRRSFAVGELHQREHVFAAR
jgi:hypothetical protein